MADSEDMVAVKWARPNSVYDGVVQYISPSLIVKEEEEGNVVVHWPRKGREPAVWRGQLANVLVAQDNGESVRLVCP